MNKINFNKNIISIRRRPFLSMGRWYTWRALLLLITLIIFHVSEVDAASITPITAFQDTQQITSEITLQPANCETAALSNGVKYLVIYCGNHGGYDTSAVSELVLEHGSTVIARGVGEGRGLYFHWDTGQTSGYYIVTGNGTDTLRFRFRCVTSSDTAYVGAMAIIAIPLTDLTENTGYFQSVSNTEDVVSNAAVGSWTTLSSQVFNLPVLETI